MSTTDGDTATAEQYAVIYVRISADPAGERAGVERQRAECADLAARFGLTVTAVYEDNDKSAYSGKPRDAFERLLADAQAADFQHVIVWATDRLYRRMADLVRITAELAPYARIHVVTGGEVDLSTADGILRAQMLGSVAEFESRRKGERIAARARQRAADGTMTASRRPFGWRWADPCPGDGTCRHKTRCTPGERARLGSRSGLVLDPAEAPVLGDCYRKIRDGASLRAVTDYAIAHGVPVAGPSSLRGVLLNTRNAGLVTHRGAVVGESADGLALIDRDTFEAVRAILTDPARRTSPVRRTSPPLGGGLARCPRCGGNLAAGRKQDGGRGAAATYVCSTHMHFSRRRHLLDGPVLDLVGQVLTSAADAGLLALATADDPGLARLREDIASREAKLDALAAMLATDDLDPADYARASRKLRESLAQLTEQLARRTNRPAVARLAADADGVAAAYARLRERAEAGDADDLRALLADVLARVTPQTDGSTVLEWHPWVGPAPSVLTGAPLATADPGARREKVAALYREGHTTGEIADALGIYRGTVRRDLRVLGLRDVTRRTGRAATGRTRAKAATAAPAPRA